MNGGLASSVEGVPGEESDPSDAFKRSGTGLGAFFLRSSNGLIGLINSDERTCTEAGRWPILPATVNRAASGSRTLFCHPFWAVSKTFNRSAMLLLVGMSPSELAASSPSVADEGLEHPAGFEILLRHSVSPLFCRAANLVRKKTNNWIKCQNKWPIAFRPCEKKLLKFLAVLQKRHSQQDYRSFHMRPTKIKSSLLRGGHWC